MRFHHTFKRHVIAIDISEDQFGRKRKPQHAVPAGPTL
ncbi:hypothetical protein EKH55_4835 [Sinorhizobium alkalisoli]|nr:hypothetical protein EKH55_4835 [Sinorhizobium alkalisoli]